MAVGILIHAYAVKNWVRVPYMIALHHLVGSASVDNLTSVILKALEAGGRLDLDVMAVKLLCFGAVVCLLSRACIMEWSSNCKTKLHISLLESIVVLINSTLH